MRIPNSSLKSFSRNDFPLPLLSSGFSQVLICVFLGARHRLPPQSRQASLERASSERSVNLVVADLQPLEKVFFCLKRGKELV